MEDESVLKQPQRLDWWLAMALGLAILGLYIATLAPTVLEADAGEFQFVPWLPGIAHPTGYPLYVLLGWAWTHLLPVGEVAWRMNLLSAMFAAGAVASTYGAARLLLDGTWPVAPWPARILAALTAAATFAVTPTFWSQAIIAEVYSLHALFLATILWLALRWQRADRRLNSSTAKGLAFLVGLSLTHHSTIILFWPALLLFIFFWRNKNGKTEAGIRLWLTHAGLLAAPLLLYIYLPLIAPATPYATLWLDDTQKLVLYDNSLAGFWNHVTGAMFAAAVQPAAAGWDRLLLTWELLRQQVGWIGVVVGLVGLITLGQKHRFDLLLLTGLGFLAFVTFNLIYFIGDIFVLFIPAWLFVCLWIGVGILSLTHWLATGFAQRKSRFIAPVGFENLNQKLTDRIYRLVLMGLLGLFMVMFVGLMTMRNIEVSQKGQFSVKERWQKILQEPVPEGAILLSNDRNEIMPLWYYQYVQERRSDLLGLFPLIVSEPAYANIGRLLEQALASGRPVYLIKPMAGLNLKANLRPEGTLFRATKINHLPTHLLEAKLPEIRLRSAAGDEITETIKLLGYEVSPDNIASGDEIIVTLYWEPTEPLSVDYTSYVHLIDKAGQGISQSDERPGGDFYPTSYWQIGEILRDRHLLTVPADLPAGRYQLRAGIYHQPEPGLINGAGLDIGSITITALPLN